MERVLRKEFALKEYYFYFCWSFYFSAGYFYCKKIYDSFFNEFPYAVLNGAA